MVKTIYPFSLLILFIFPFSLLVPSEAESKNYCDPQYQGGFGDPFFTHIRAFHLEDINHEPNTLPPALSYEDNTHLQTSLVQGETYDLTIELGNGANDQTLALWIDYSQSGQFSIMERLFTIDNTGGDGNRMVDTTIQIPENATPGETRLRVGTSLGFGPPSTCNISDLYHHIQDYKVNIVEPEAQKIDSVYTLRNTEAEIVKGSSGNEIIGVNIRTNEEGRLNPLTVDEFNFSKSGTEIPGDIESASLYYSRGKASFDPNNIQEQLTSPDFDFSFSPGTTLKAGNNYFWLTYEVDSDAEIGNKVNAAFKEAIVQNISYSSDSAQPAGYRDIGYCKTYGIQNNFVFIDGITLDSINNQTGEEASGYGDYTAQKTRLHRDSIYPVSMLIGNGFNEATIRLWIDQYRTGTFDNSDDLLLDRFWPAGDPGDPDNTPIQDSIYIEPDAELGETRMRVNANFSDPAGACAQPIETGEAEDYTVKIVEDGYPIADFSFQEACIDDTISFNEQAEVQGNATITSYDWNFGDGNSSTDPDPNHIYEQPGLYEVTLTVTSNAPGNPTHSVSQKVFVPDPEVSFSYSKSSAGQPVNFSGHATNAKSPSWKWHFNDPYASKDSAMSQVAQHTYDSAGQYQVELAVAESGCKDTATQTLNLSSKIPPQAAFNVDSEPFEQQQVQIQNLSINEPDQFSWDFDPSAVTFHQNTTANDESPVVSFDNPGSYQITLIAENDAGADTAQKSISVQSFDPPQADFFAFPTTISAGENVDFTNESSRNPVAYHWSFGNGDSSSIANPFQAYEKPGFYTVSLTASNPAGSDTETKTSFIEVTDEFRMCRPHNNISALDTGELYDSGGPNEEYLDFTDCGFLIEPECPGPIVIHFNSFDMDNGDYVQVFDGRDRDGEPLHTGQGFTGDSLPDSLVAYSGAVFIRENNNTFFDADGFHLSWYTMENKAPQVSFDTDSAGYLESPVDFENTSQKGVGDSYYWDFNNDGTINDTGDVTETTYSDTGTFEVKLLGQNCAGSDSSTQQIQIREPDTLPTADFYADRDTLPLGQPLYLFDASYPGPNEWSWDIPSLDAFFTLDTDENSQDPIVGFIEPGFYDVHLTVSNILGESTPLRRENFILVQPTIDPCDGPSISEEISGVLDFPEGEGEVYEPDTRCSFTIAPECADSVGFVFKDFQFASDDYLRLYDDRDTNNANALHSGMGFTNNNPPPDTLFSGSGEMEVVVETDSLGHTLSEGFSAEWFSIMQDTAKADFEGPDTILMGQKPAFTDKSEGEIVQRYWDFNSDGTINDTGETVSHQFTQSGNFTVRLLSESCTYTDTAEKELHVIHKDGPPEADFKASHRKVPVESKVYLTDLSTENPWAWEWNFSPSTVSFEEETDSSSQDPTVRFEEEGTYDVSLKASNFLGTDEVIKPLYIEAFSYCSAKVAEPASLQGNFIIGNDSVGFKTTASGAPNPIEDTLEIARDQYHQFIIELDRDLSDQNTQLWIDQNRDGTFDERLSQQASLNGQYWVDNLKLPANTRKGFTRMRVASSPDEKNGPCDSLSSGFVQDFVVEVTEGEKQPFVKLDGRGYVMNNVCETYEPQGAFAEYPDGTIRRDNIIEEGEVDTSTPGLYIKRYILDDPEHPKVPPTIRIVDIRANHQPEITLEGPDTVRMQVFESYQDSGGTVKDLCDGQIDDSLRIVEYPDTTTLGVHHTRYVAKNSFGNGSDTVSRAVEVFDTIGPEISLLGDDTMTLQKGFPYDEPGAIAIDHYFGALPVDIEGEVNTEEVGSYELEYNSEDPVGNKATPRIRLVKVEDVLDVPEKIAGGQNIHFYPNPVRDQLFIEFEEPSASELQIRILDITGREQVSREFDNLGTSSPWILDLSGLSSGTYLISWETEGSQGYEELIKQQ